MGNQRKRIVKSFTLLTLLTIICLSLKLFNIFPSQATKGATSLTEADFPSPVKGHVLRKTGNYYSEEINDYLFHAGTDYAEPEGTVIRVTYGGKVIYAGPDYYLGQKVVIDCGQDWLITYGGLENLQVTAGEIIEKNTAIGQVGYFFETKGSHSGSLLHYEIRNGDGVRLEN